MITWIRRLICKYKNHEGNWEILRRPPYIGVYCPLCKKYKLTLLKTEFRYPYHFSDRTILTWWRNQKEDINYED